MLDLAWTQVTTAPGAVAHVTVRGTRLLGLSAARLRVVAEGADCAVADAAAAVRTRGILGRDVLTISDQACFRCVIEHPVLCILYCAAAKLRGSLGCTRSVLDCQYSRPFFCNGDEKLQRSLLCVCSQTRSRSHA